MLWTLWKLLIRKVAPRQLDSLAGRQGRPDWPVVLRRGVLQGFVGGSTPWLVLGAVAALVRVSQKVGEGRTKVLLVDRLGPGEALAIVDTAIERRKGRR